MEHDVLKPCPFCGGRAQRSDCADYVAVFCTVCSVVMQCWHSLDPLLAVQRWNRRHVSASEKP